MRNTPFIMVDTCAKRYEIPAKEAQVRLQQRFYYLTLACNIDLGYTDLCHIGCIWPASKKSVMDIKFVPSDMKIGHQMWMLAQEIKFPFECGL